MRYLLDTQAFVWLVSASRRVPEGIETELAGEEAEIYVSDVSAYEIAFKVGLGKLNEAASLARDWAGAVAGAGARSLALNTRHAVAAGLLDWSHRDPFDRMIVAQASEEGLTLVSADGLFADAPGVTLLRW